MSTHRTATLHARVLVAAAAATCMTAAACSSSGQRRGDADGGPAGVTDGGASPDASIWSCTPPYQRSPYQPAPDDSVALESLLEASGNGSSAASDWVGIAAGDLCGDAGSEVVAVKNAHSYFVVLGGPTPVAIGSGDLSSSAASPWHAVAAGNLDGTGRDEIVGARRIGAAGVSDFVVARASDTCAVSQIATGTVGTAGNSDWVGVAAGDFDGDGTDEVVAVKNAHSSFVMMALTGKTLGVTWAGDLDSDGAAPWRAVGAGDLDGDGTDELVAARSASDGTSATILVYRWTGTAFQKLASSTLGNTGNSLWAGLTVGDFNGDGRAAIALAKDQASSFVVLDLPPGGSSLAVRGSGALASAPGQAWRGLAAADWLDGDGGAAELIAARHTTGAYRANMFVYGSGFHRALRASALAGSHAQYAAEPRASDTDPADIAELESWLTTTHANAYSFLLYDATGQDYLDFVRFLDATRDFCIDGRQLRVWVTLIPPTEHRSGRCSIPVDSPLTDFDDTAFFAAGAGEASCEDYAGWARLLGRLARDYPQLVAVTIDDASHNLSGALTPEVVAQIDSALHGAAPWLSLVPTSYYRSSGGVPVATAYPDVGLTVDSLLFYFRNEKQGEGPCSACATPKPCAKACLAGTCAEATVANAPGEIADMARLLPADRTLQVGGYFTGHSACGEPSARYDDELFQTAMGLPGVGGVQVYTTKHPAIDCTEDSYLDDKGCVVEHLFAP